MNRRGFLRSLIAFPGAAKACVAREALFRKMQTPLWVMHKAQERFFYDKAHRTIIPQRKMMARIRFTREALEHSIRGAR